MKTWDAQLTLCLLCQQEVETVQILADALPKIVPYVLINHREVFPLPFLLTMIPRISHMIDTCTFWLPSFKSMLLIT